MTIPAPRCPFCSSPAVIPDGPRNWWCHDCKRTFDGIDDGDIGYGRPDKRIERQERTTKTRQRERR